MKYLHLFFVFFTIGLFSVGGGYAIIPLIGAEVVTKYEWITEGMFTDIITISQMTPGPIAVNTATFVGLQIAGVLGAILATVGCIISGIVISITLYRIFSKHSESAVALEVLKGMKASSLGLIVSAAATILLLTFTGSGKINLSANVDWIAVVVFAGAICAIRKWKINPIIVIIISGIIGAFIY